MQYVGEEDIAEAILGGSACGKGGRGEGAGGVYGHGGGWLEGKLRANSDAREIDRVDDDVRGIGNQERA